MSVVFDWVKKPRRVIVAVSSTEAGRSFRFPIVLIFRSTLRSSRLLLHAIPASGAIPSDRLISSAMSCPSNVCPNPKEHFSQLFASKMNVWAPSPIRPRIRETPMPPRHPTTKCPDLSFKPGHCSQTILIRPAWQVEIACRCQSCSLCHFIRKTPVGHRATQMPQPTHRSGFTFTIPPGLPTLMAPAGQRVTHRLQAAFL